MSENPRQGCGWVGACRTYRESPLYRCGAAGLRLHALWDSREIGPLQVLQVCQVVVLYPCFAKIRLEPRNRPPRYPFRKLVPVPLAQMGLQMGLTRCDSGRDPAHGYRSFVVPPVVDGVKNLGHAGGKKGQLIMGLHKMGFLGGSVTPYSGPQKVPPFCQALRTVPAACA